MKVAIAGFGIEGESNYRYWSRRGADVTIIDERSEPARPLPRGAKSLLGEGAFGNLYSYGLVVRTASLPPGNIVTNGKIWSATNEFFKRCSAPIIGVTGTKGKGTISSLIASILRAAGHTVHLVGNIGVPALDVLDDIDQGDIVVYELSSFQLWDLERSPHVAVIGMIEADHLDIHADFADYIQAKSNIRRFQRPDDVCFYHPTNRYAAKIAESTVLGDMYRYAMAKDGAVYIHKNNFVVQSDPICEINNVQLPGRHNLENACAAISAARVFTLDEQAIARGLNSFTGLPHRLKFVREIRGIRYYDDSIATTPGSAIAALHAFGGDKTIILGGSDKGALYDAVIEECSKQAAKVIAIGQTGERIHVLCRAFEVPCVRVEGLMPEVVQVATEQTKPGGVVILSPASASFDQYRSYSDRGDKFIAAVQQLADS